MKEKLEPAEDGLYTLKDEYRIMDAGAPDNRKPRFVLTGEISSIYKKNEKVRKVHSLLLLPGLEEADRLARRAYRKYPFRRKADSGIGLQGFAGNHA